MSRFLLTTQENEEGSLFILSQLSETFPTCFRDLHKSYHMHLQFLALSKSKIACRSKLMMSCGRPLIRLKFGKTGSIFFNECNKRIIEINQASDERHLWRSQPRILFHFISILFLFYLVLPFSVRLSCFCINRNFTLSSVYFSGFCSKTQHFMFDLLCTVIQSINMLI